MLRLGFSLGINAVRSVIGVVTAFWNDARLWNDNDVWKD